jgi:hypothetical protein
LPARIHIRGGQPVKAALDAFDIRGHGQAPEDLQSLLQARGGRVGLADARVAVADAFQGAGLVLALACPADQSQRVAVKDASAP